MERLLLCCSYAGNAGLVTVGSDLELIVGYWVYLDLDTDFSGRWFKGSQVSDTLHSAALLIGKHALLSQNDGNFTSCFDVKGNCNLKWSTLESPQSWCCQSDV